MKVRKLGADRNTCNFCIDGELVEDQIAIIRPYKEVIEVEGRGVVFNICPKCTADLKNKLIEAL